MPAKKIVQIILIILCTLTILAGCVNTAPQEPSAQAAQAQVSEAVRTSAATTTQTPTQAPTQAPTPEPTPEPTPQAATVTISIDCRNATEGGVPGAPGGGWILGKKTVELETGDTVWDVLNRICRDRGIAINKSGSGASIFVKAIGGVASVSAQSGWMFSVNGVYVMAGAGKVTVSAGDSIRWKYTMNGGDDL